MPPASANNRPFAPVPPRAVAYPPMPPAPDFTSATGGGALNTTAPVRNRTVPPGALAPPWASASPPSLPVT